MNCNQLFLFFIFCLTGIFIARAMEPNPIPSRVPSLAALAHARLMKAQHGKVPSTQLSQDSLTSMLAERFITLVTEQEADRLFNNPNPVSEDLRFGAFTRDEIRHRIRHEGIRHMALGRTQPVLDIALLAAIETRHKICTALQKLSQVEDKVGIFFAEDWKVRIEKERSIFDAIHNLLQRGASPLACQPLGDTALEWAQEREDLELLNLLLSNMGKRVVVPTS